MKKGVDELRTLLVFLHEGSVSRAAHKLGLSQPAASNALARLRTHFGDPLLLPSRSGMVATDRARAIEPEARALVAAYDALLHPPHAFDAATSRRKFVVTCPEFAEHVLMPDLFKQMRRHAPQMRLEVKPPDPARVVQWLESGQVDLRIAWPWEPVASLRFTPLFQDRIVCVADRRHPAIGKELTLATFLSLPQVQHAVAGRQTSIGRAVEEAVKGRGGTMSQTFLVQNFLTIPSIITGSDLIAMLPERLATSLARDHALRVLPAPLKLPRIRYAAYWHERSQKDPAHRWLRAMVLEVARTATRAVPRT